jgi:hypothetical protein
MKKKIVPFLCISIIAVVLDLMLSGFQFYIYGICSFNTKYYDTPQMAFEQEIDDCSIEKDIAVVEIDSHNVMYFARTVDGDILVAQMKCKNNEYFFVGDYTTASYETLFNHSEKDVFFQQNCMYKENGWFKSNFEYAIINEKANQSFDDYKITKIDIDESAIVYFVYRIID